MSADLTDFLNGLAADPAGAVLPPAKPPEPPSRYFVNVWRAGAALNVEGYYAHEDDALQEIAIGFPRLAYHHTLIVDGDTARVEDWTDKAAAWQGEAERDADANRDHDRHCRALWVS